MARTRRGRLKHGERVGRKERVEGDREMKESGAREHKRG